MEVKPLRQGSVPAGYKQTEVGVIPEEWKETKLGDGITLLSGHHILANHCNTRGIGTPYITGPADFPNGVISHSKFTDRPSTVCKEGDILVTVKGSGAGSLVVANAPYCISRQLMAIRVADWDKSFIFYSLVQNATQFRAASTGLIPGLSRSDIKDQLLPLPPPPEQRAIAAALSDVDGLLGGLDRLIAKKRDLKQAAMQQLLTGQTRLPGFNGEWEVKRLDELGTWKGGMTPSMQNPAFWHGGTVPWISSGDVKSVLLTQTGFSITPLAVKRGATTMLPPNSIVLVTRSGILRKYLPVAMNVIPMAINQDIKALVPAEIFSAEYLLHALIGNGDQILKRCMKAGTTVESVEFRWLKAFTIPIPPLREQTAIAEALTEMDQELAALEQRREKTRALKQAMMQELLTGKTRLL